MALPGHWHRRPPAAAELDCFGRIGRLDAVMAGEVGNGPCHGQTAEVSASGEPELSHGGLHQVEGLRGTGEKLLSFSRPDLPVQPSVAKPSSLSLAGLDDLSVQAGAFAGGWLASTASVLWPCPHLDPHVDAIQQRAGQMGEILAYMSFTATARLVRVAKVAAGTRVHGRYQDESGREGNKPSCPGQAGDTLLERQP